MSLNLLDSLGSPLNELSLKLMMLDSAEVSDQDPVIRRLLGSVEAGLGGDVVSQRIGLSLRYCRENCSAETLETFISSANALIAGTEAVLPGEGAKEEAFADLAGEIEPEFLIEFIEKHTTMMEEFDATIMELCRLLDSGTLTGENAEEKRSEFDRYAKGYIHNVKGDAGSIGLLGVERVCHFIEDYILQNGASRMTDALLVFKEWVVHCMKALSEGEQPTESGVDFKKRFVTMISAGETKRSSASNYEVTEGGELDEAAIAAAMLEEPATATSAPTDDLVRSTYGEDLGADANFDLLAELMGEGDHVGVPAIPALEVAKVKVIRPVAVAVAKPVESPTESSYAISGEADVFQEFIVEAQDHLGSIESTLLESSGSISKDMIDAIFRGIHSIKGASSYFTLRDTTETSHLTETVLDEVRDGKRPFDAPLTELVLEYVSIQQVLFSQARTAVSSGSLMKRYPQAKSYLERLQAYYKGEAIPVRKEVAPTTETGALSTKSAPPAVGDEGKAAQKNAGEKLEVKNFVKVDTVRLDELIDSIGEMCIYSSMLVKKCREMLGDDESIVQTTHQVAKVSRDLQNIGMSMRLIPIRGLFQKMSRLVWDTSKKIKKEIKFVMHGEDTELDRTIIDKLADPLMHMIRNALDHGVEPPDEREQTGKTRSGTITLSAQHASGNIQVIIQDDGRGLNPEKLIKKAVEKGIVREDQKVSREEAFQLIFAAGFSTAAAVTDISGRGVGMDVVKRNIESLRGRVNIQSEVGKGTTFTIELPLTLAVLDGIEVMVGRDSFIIPTLSVIEFIKPLKEQITHTFDTSETFQFRGRYLPVFRLSEIFEVEEALVDPEKALFIIVESIGEQAAIMVDAIVGTHSTVIKSLGDMFEQGRGLSGCAIMSSGEVSLILDIRSLVTMAREGRTVSASAAQQSASAAQPSASV